MGFALRICPNLLDPAVMLFPEGLFKLTILKTL